MTEAELQEAVIELCKLRGLWVYHPHDSRRSEPGWPDLAVLGSRGALFAELKSEDGRCSRVQLNVAGRIRAAGLAYRLWRPIDWTTGTIRNELEAIR